MAAFRATRNRGQSAVTDTPTEYRTRRSLWQRLGDHKVLFLLFLPVAVYYVVFRYWPIALAWVVAFKDLKLGAGVFESEWVGLSNFVEIFTDPELFHVLVNTVEISGLRLAAGFLPPILLAIMFHDMVTRRFTAFAQTVVYIPHFFSWVIIYGIVFALFATGSGLVNNALEWLGQGRIDFLLSEDWFRPILIVSGVWKELGWSTIIYMAALATVDPHLYEAAAIDGAGPLQRLRHITIPTIMPVISFVLAINLGFILFAGGEQILMFYNPAVFDTADVIDTWVYREGLGRLQFSLGTAMGLFQAFVGLLLVLCCNWAAKRMTGRGIW